MADEVSIHAFRGEGDTQQGAQRQQCAVSIHAFRGEGDARTSDGMHARAVSIHAFRGEGDWGTPKPAASRTCFNPRLPGGRRRECSRQQNQTARVSIHAFRGEGDSSVPSTGSTARCFNPRLPGGRRLADVRTILNNIVFQSTPSGGKATSKATTQAYIRQVSIHAFRGEGDARAAARRSRTGSFNPRLPGGRRLQYLGLLCPVPARYCSMIRIFRVALGTICPYIRFLRCC